MSGRRPINLVIPGPPDTRTGGFIYDARVADGLRRARRMGELLSLGPGYPEAESGRLETDIAALGARKRPGVTVIDGLCFTALSARRGHRPWPAPTVALVHHPLCDETGLPDTDRRALFDAERQALATACGCIVTSGATGRRLADFGCGPGSVRVVPPGLDRPDAVPVRDGAGPVRLLCVANLIPRKGHDVLLEALAGLAHLDWRLDLVGPAPDRAWAARIAGTAARHPAAARIRIHREVDDPSGFYRRSDVFVLASRHEGFGMALAEAMAFGLPVLSCRAGAISDTVPADAGILVHPDDPAAFAAALSRLITDARLRSRLGTAGRAASRQFADWDATARSFSAAVDALTAAG